MSSSFEHLARKAAMVFAVILALASQSHAQTADEAALRLSLMLSREFTCLPSEPVFTIASVPAEDPTGSLDPQAVLNIGSVILDSVRRDALDCVRITDVALAFDTLGFVQNLGSWSDLGASQRERVQTELSNADAILTIILNRAGEGYTATLSIVELASGRTLATARAEIPDALTSVSCGASAASEARGLNVLATNLTERLNDASVFHIAPAAYQDSTETPSYGRYISDQFIAALSEVGWNVITGSTRSVRRRDVDASPELGPNEYAVTLRYWPCDDETAIRLNVAATSMQGDVLTLAQDLSLMRLPAGLAVIPRATAIPTEVARDEPNLGFMFLQPRLIQVGQLLTISAEPPATCDPFFFDVSPSGRLTPLPLSIFDITELRPGVLRYDNNASSRYGVIVQPEDEPGLHRLGYICQPSELNEDGVRDVLRQVRRENDNRLNGVITTDGPDVVFNTQMYEILR